MYKLSKRLKITAITLILIGAIGWVHSYKASHHLTLEDVEVMLAEEHSHHGNGASHNEDLNNKTDHTITPMKLATTTRTTIMNQVIMKK
jgi:hypothetical protein